MVKLIPFSVFGCAKPACNLFTSGVWSILRVWPAGNKNYWK